MRGRRPRGRRPAGSCAPCSPTPPHPSGKDAQLKEALGPAQGVAGEMLGMGLGGLWLQWRRGQRVHGMGMGQRVLEGRWHASLASASTHASHVGAVFMNGQRRAFLLLCNRVGHKGEGLGRV